MEPLYFQTSNSKKKQNYTTNRSDIFILENYKDNKAKFLVL